MWGCGSGRHTVGANAATHESTSNVQQNVSIDDDTLWANHTELIIEGTPDYTDGGIFFANQVNLEVNSTDIKSDSQPLWMLDSGCSHTMTYQHENFVSFTLLKLPVKSATGQHFWTEGYGKVNLRLTTLDGKSLGSMHLKNTWLAPELKHNLISIQQLAWIGICTMFNKHENIEISQQGKTMAYVITVGNHYYLCTPFTQAKMDIVEEHSTNIINLRSDNKVIPISIAHQQTAHVSEHKLRQTMKNAVGFNISKETLPGPCEPCIMGKSHRKPVARQTCPINLKPGDLIVTDVCGLFNTHSYGGGKYFVTFTDVTTHYCWVFAIKHRSEVVKKFKILENYLKVQHNITIKKVHTNSTGKHDALDDYLVKTGWVWDPTPGYSLMLNGIPEIKN